MKPKKEVVFIITAGFFLLAYILDYFSGALRLNIHSPLDFLDQKFLSLYPMTFVAIMSRAIAIMLSIGLILSLIERKYFTKLGIAAFLFFIAEIYGFQQLATGARFSSLQWTLSISYGGALLIIPMILYLISGISNVLIPQTSSDKFATKSEDSSFLNPQE